MKTKHAEVASTSIDPADPRPRFGIGHLSMEAADVGALTAFYAAVGMRVVVQTESFAILELRGGTHIVVRGGRAGGSTLDLIVDDIDETRTVLADAGAEVTEIRRGNPHDRFEATDPEGNVLLVNSNHAMGPV